MAIKKLYIAPITETNIMHTHGVLMESMGFGASNAHVQEGDIDNGSGAPMRWVF